MNRRQALTSTIEDIQHALLRLANLGWQGFDCAGACRETTNSWGSAPGFSEGTPTETLSDIRRDLGECTRCKLSEHRHRIVFGAGNARARLVFVGEGPGYDEDLQGEPFVGAAGQLLTRIIKAMGLERETVYICNIVKCRPPDNRNPQPNEIGACTPFLERQLRSIAPEYICALGTCAARTLLKTAAPISRLRGRFFDCMGAKLLPTYHPAYLLRNPDKKRDVWEDMKMLMGAMDLPLPERKGEQG